MNGFLTSLNLLNVGRQISLLGIMAVGMKIAALMVAAAAVLLPLSAYADGPVKVSDFPLADRIKEKVASGKPLDIYVSYHDVSNEFAPAIKAGVAKAAAEDKVDAQFVGPVGADASAQINEIETLMGKMDGLAISSVSSDALSPVIDRVLKAGIPVVTYNTDNPNSKRLAFA
jgi:simple sugar transport system substrate-binding protein